MDCEQVFVGASTLVLCDDSDGYLPLLRWLSANFEDCGLCHGERLWSLFSRRSFFVDLTIVKHGELRLFRTCRLHSSRLRKVCCSVGKMKNHNRPKKKRFKSQYWIPIVDTKRFLITNKTLHNWINFVFISAFNISLIMLFRLELHKDFLRT